VTSLHRHVGDSWKDGESLIDVVPALNEAEVVMTWDWGCDAMLGACVGVNEILGGILKGQKLGRIADRY
jgi:hypothetical protein